MDDIDARILDELQRDGRLSNQDLADRVGLSPSPCLRRVRRLEEVGVLTGYRAVVDPRAVGLAITAFVRLRLESHSPEIVARVEAAIREIPHVTEAYLMAGDSDFLLKVAVEDLESYETLVRTRIRMIPALASIETSFAYGVTKPQSPLPARR
ncbi:AsnC family transcriptional regulator [Rathayibacter sp. Leaf299]|uniref:Lrp/AsnC family transcriptional regulator n=1 Tax=unclassified Rathayibacter TaxID=2609250 RepID=UPI0006F63144|nr:MULTISPECIES: Lrp/AsnC family transcriptional regulator [unclassified Rathayibacter]KQQ20995.1 AsnC family transcriptional regulator [Rathayibacter sp. Leaf299]